MGHCRALQGLHADELPADAGKQNVCFLVLSWMECRAFQQGHDSRRLKAPVFGDKQGGIAFREGYWLPRGFRGYRKAHTGGLSHTNAFRPQRRRSIGMEQDDARGMRLQHPCWFQPRLRIQGAIGYLWKKRHHRHGKDRFHPTTWMSQFGRHATGSFQGRHASRASSTSISCIDECCITLFCRNIPSCTIVPFLNLVAACGLVLFAQGSSCRVHGRSSPIHIHPSTFATHVLIRMVTFPSSWWASPSVGEVTRGTFRRSSTGSISFLFFFFEPAGLGLHRRFRWGDTNASKHTTTSTVGRVVARGHGRTLRRHRVGNRSQRMHPQRSPVGQRDEGARMETSKTNERWEDMDTQGTKADPRNHDDRCCTWIATIITEEARHR